MILDEQTTVPEVLPLSPPPLAGTLTDFGLRLDCTVVVLTLTRLPGLSPELAEVECFKVLDVLRL